MRLCVAVLIAALVVAGLWAPDSPANAQGDCVGEGAVSPSEAALVPDCEALLDARDTLAGTATLNWAADVPIEEWEGISVGGTPARVVGLSLVSRELTGTIPRELGNLSNLTVLDLSWNDLSGEIPTEFGNLSKLTYLNLGENQLTGTIPPQLGILSNLTEMNLGENRLTGTIPTHLGNLSNLTEMNLGGNQLTGSIPIQLRNLSNLTDLNLSGNRLTGTIPTQLGNLSNLTDLDLGGNRLTDTIPAQIGNLSSLTVLNLADNQLTRTIPLQLGNLDNLTILILGGNRLVGAIPTQLSNLDNLTVLNLSGNQLTELIPSHLGSLSNLAWLELSDNQLTGSIPPQLGNLSNLIHLGVANNRLTGELPEGLTGLASLETLTFFNNTRLCAPIDNAFQRWLQRLYSFHGSSCARQDSQQDRAVLTQFYDSANGANWENSSNWTIGRPVREWHGVTNDANGRVTGLYLRKNQLSGTIPPELGDLSEMTWLDLGDNQLTGEIPPELGDLSNLRALYLRNNGLTGCIPAELLGVESNDLDELGLPTCGIPTVTTGVDSASYLVRIGSPITVTATFSELVHGFTADDITVANGTADNLIGGDGDSVFTFDVSPNAIRVVTVDIAAGVAESYYDGNGNTAAVQLILGLPYDDDHDGAISRDEVINAVEDYLFGDSAPTLDHVLDLIDLYLFG